jgi:hypothetical protein
MHQRFQMKNTRQEVTTLQLLQAFLEATIEGTQSHVHNA